MQFSSLLFQANQIASPIANDLSLISGVGKTSIVIRHKENRFDPSVFHTLGASYHRFVM